MFFVFLFTFWEPLAKRDMWHILLHNDRIYYAKRDSCFAAYGGVVLQRFEFIKFLFVKPIKECPVTRGAFWFDR